MEVNFINNQYDNVMRGLPLNAKTFKNILNIIKHPLIIESKDRIPQWKFCTTNGNKRCSENMKNTNILILDFDDAEYSMDEFENAFKEYRYILHTSYSYDGNNSKFRIILFLDKEYEINRIFFKCYDRIFSPYHILLKTFPHIDPASFVRAQFFKIPAIKEKDSPYVYKIHDGKLFNLDEIDGFNISYYRCVQKQEEYYRKMELELAKNRKAGEDLSRAKEYIEKKIEAAESGNRHMVIFSLACWWKRIGGSFTEFKNIIPSWADSKYKKQIDKLRDDWNKLRIR